MQQDGYLDEIQYTNTLIIKKFVLCEDILQLDSFAV